MDDPSRMGIDYQRAAERLLVALSFIARKLPGRPVPAVSLCAHIFDHGVRRHWSRETRRRRVRDAAETARNLIHERHTTVTDIGHGSLYEDQLQLVGNGAGYLLTGDSAIIKWYADQRRRRGLTELAAGSQVKRDLASAGQQKLFGG